MLQKYGLIPKRDCVGSTRHSTGPAVIRRRITKGDDLFVEAREYRTEEDERDSDVAYGGYHRSAPPERKSAHALMLFV
jgi:hypothetical protein